MAIDLTSEITIKNLHNEWCNTIEIAQNHVEKIIQFYAPEAILIPTLSSDFLVNKNDGFVPYFTMLTNLPHIKCTQHMLITHIHDGMATNVGLYYFTFEEKGLPISLPARFTFVYKKIQGKWLIISHHSSRMP